MLEETEKSLFNGKENSETVKDIKSFIRSSEAKVSIHTLGVTPNNAYCLKLPFYSKKSQRKEPTEEDYSRVRDLMKITEPTVIYAAGTDSFRHR